MPRCKVSWLLCIDRIVPKHRHVMHNYMLGKTGKDVYHWCSFTTGQWGQTLVHTLYLCGDHYVACMEALQMLRGEIRTFIYLCYKIFFIWQSLRAWLEIKQAYNAAVNKRGNFIWRESLNTGPLLHHSRADSLIRFFLLFTTSQGETGSFLQAEFIWEQFPLHLTTALLVYCTFILI